MKTNPLLKKIVTLAEEKKAEELIGYHPEVHFKEGLKYTLEYGK